MAGIADWLAFGLPTEGKRANALRVGPASRHDVPTCGLTDSIADVRKKIAAADWDSCIVVNEHCIVLGRVRSDDLDGDPGQQVENIMEPGPSTVRQSEYLEALVKRMKEEDVNTIIVTSSDGTLIGVLCRDEGEQRLAEHKRS